MNQSLKIFNFSVCARVFRVGVLLLLVFPVFVEARMVTPLHITVAEPIINEQGVVIQGNALMPLEERPLVQVLGADAGALPPNFYGHPDPQNPVLQEVGIGSLISPALERPGLFGAALANPRPTSGQVFVRVFNAPTIEESLFYADSQVLTVDSTNSVLFAEFGSLTNQIDDAANRVDENGLNLLWKLETFGDAYMDIHADLDGDGTTVWEEYIAGTDMNDSGDVFILTQMRPAYSDTEYTDHVWQDDDPESPFFGTWFTQRMYAVDGHVLAWPSAVGRYYTIEYVTNLMSSMSYLVTNDVLATPPANVFTNYQISEDGEVRFYRARVRWPDAPELE
jgi:hypothetical protein